MGITPLASATERNAALVADVQTMKVKDVAKKYGLSRQRVHQLQRNHRKALLKPVKV